MLGPVTLTSLGVGVIIGAGIFVSTGVIARQTSGPALMLSYVAGAFGAVITLTTKGVIAFVGCKL